MKQIVLQNPSCKPIKDEILLAKNREYARQWREKILSDPERKDKYLAERRERSRERRKNLRLELLTKAKQRAKNKNLPFDLVVDDIVIPEFCPILGIKLAPSKNAPSDGSPSLDRINNSLGYVKGNVHVISCRANRIKNDSSLEELKLVVKYLESI
jgi:hypothetical protein